MLFQPLVGHGQPSACWVWAHALLITAVPIGGSRAAVPTNTWKAQSSCDDKLDWLEDPCALNIESGEAWPPGPGPRHAH